MKVLPALACLALSSAAPFADATTYAVGSGRPYASLQALLTSVTLQPGDVVEVDGGATYPGGVILRQSGTAAQPITVRGLRVNGQRPVLAGGTNTIEFRQSNHVVLEGFEITRKDAEDIIMSARVVAGWITAEDLAASRAGAAEGEDGAEGEGAGMDEAPADDAGQNQV